MTVKSATRTFGLPPWSLAVVAMLSVQLSAAWSMDLITEVGAGGTAWLRLTAGAVIFLALARPSLRAMRRHDVPVLLGLGLASGLMGVMFLAAIERIPLGTAVAIEFLGPLTVAAVRSHDKQALVWPVLALLGVLLLTEPWQGEIDPVGVGFAAGAGIGWGAYIVLTQRVGDRFTGIQGLALTVPIATLRTDVSEQQVSEKSSRTSRRRLCWPWRRQTEWSPLGECPGGYSGPAGFLGGCGGWHHMAAESTL